MKRPRRAPARYQVLSAPRRSQADIVIHVSWDDLAATSAAGLMGWVRRCRAQQVLVHVDVVSPATIAQHLLLGLCATSLALHAPAAMALPADRTGPTGRPRTPDELCRQLQLSGAGARIVRRAAHGSLLFGGRWPAVPDALNG